MLRSPLTPLTCHGSLVTVDDSIEENHYEIVVITSFSDALLRDGPCPSRVCFKNVAMAFSFGSMW